VPTEELILRLRALDDGAWQEVEYGQPVLNAHKVAHMLKGFKVRPDRWMVTAPSGQRVQHRGYFRAGLADAWTRYLGSAADVG
jgi:hypothetical protein